MAFSHKRVRFRPLGYVAIVVSLIGLGLCFLHSPIQRVIAADAVSKLTNPDLVCRSCHQQIYDRYRQTPMAQGSGLAVDGLDAIQLAAKDLVHPSSGVTYRVFLRENQPYLSYSRPAQDPRGSLSGEHRLDFFVGSGHRGRTYLYQEAGFWFEAPINWYGKSKQWDMAPAFDGVHAMPDPLPVDPNCLHCHAGNVQPSSGAARNHYTTQPFSSGGIGCGACHGDPTAHLAQTRSTGVHGQSPSGQAVPTSIINAIKLDPVRRDSICLQCHLEGDATVYLPGKSLQMFKPGDDLFASVTYFTDRNRAALGLRASSQYEALLRSACKRGAADRLTCTTCHDPHSSPTPAERVAFFRARCLSCHTGDAIATKHHPEQRDCATCHMPTRKTADISHEQLTDHDIEALPNPSPETLTRMPVELTPVGKASAGNRELGLAYAQLAQRGDQASGRLALTLLQKAEQAGSADSEVLDQLGFLLQISGSTRSAADHYLAALRQNPQDITAAANLAVIDATNGQIVDAIRLLSKVVQEDPSQTAAGLNLAFLNCRTGQKTEAATIIRLMLRYNPDSVPARRFLEMGSYGNQHCDVH